LDSLPEIEDSFGDTNTILLAAAMQGQTLLFFLLAALILLAFIISGAEVALFSLNSRDVNLLKTKEHPTAKKITSLLEESKQVYTSLLIAGTFVNICIIVLANYLINAVFEPTVFLKKMNITGSGLLFYTDLLIKVIVIGFILIFFGKILPKVWATQNNIRFAYGAVPVIEMLHLLLRRISHWMVKLADNVGRRLGATTSQTSSLQKLGEAIDITSEEETSAGEKNILKGIVRFGNITVKQVMRSRLDVSGVEYTTSFHTLIKRIEELHYSRLPVYKVNLDEVTGVLNTKDVLPYLNENDQFDWHVLIRPPFFVPETKLIEDLLKEFQTRRIHFAVVVDEFGGTSGIVTLEDILEEVIGDIRDEFDDEETAFQKLDDKNYVFEGKTKIDDVCILMGLATGTFDKVKGDSESVAGLVLELAGELPKVNDVIPCGDFELTVLEIAKNRIKKVKITIKEREA